MNLHLGLQSRFVFKAYESSTRPSALTAIIASIFLSFEAGCQSHNPPKLAPKAPPPPVAEVPPEALGRTIVAPPREAPPPPMQIEVDLKALTPRTFVGLQQSGAPQPIWTLNHYLALGLPVISPNGRWLVITRQGNGFKHGECLVVVDLVNRSATDYKVPAPGLVGTAVFSRDGRQLLGIVDTPAGYGLARWDFPAMTLTTTALGPGAAFAAAFTHAQDRVVVMREDGVIGVFNLSSGAKLFEVSFQQGKVAFYTTAIAISPDDSVVTSGAIHPGNEWVRWSLTDGARLESPMPHELLNWGRPVTYTADGHAVLVAAHHEMMLLAESTGERLATYPGNGLNSLHNQPGVGLAAAPIGQGETFGIIDTRTGQLRMWAKHTARPPAPLGYAGWAAISPDGKTAYSADYFSVKAWDLGAELARKPEWLFAGHPARRLFKSPDGRRLLAVGETVDSWDLESGRLLSSQPSPWLRDLRGGDQPEWRTGRQTRGLYLSGDRIRAIVLDDEGAQIYDLKDGRAIMRLGAPLSQAAATTLHGTNPTVVATREPPQPLANFPQKSGYPGISVSPDGTRLLVTATNGAAPSVTLWNLENGRLLHGFDRPSNVPRLARFSTDGRAIVIVGANGEISVTQIDLTGAAVTTEVVVPPSSQANQATSEANDVLMPLPDRLYVGTQQGVLSTWVRIDGRWSQLREHHLKTANTSFQFPAIIARLVASASGRTLAVVTFDPANQGSVLVLDAANGTVEACLEDNVADAIFVNERTLATSSVRLWSLDEFSAHSQP